MLVNLSRGGAFVATEAAPPPSVGEHVRLRIEVDPVIEVEGRVVNTLGDGFAVEFPGASVDLLELLAGLGAG